MTWRQFVRSEWKTLAAIVTFSITFAALLFVIHESHAHPTANQFCEGHGGVRNLDAGGFYSPPAATCNDGTAGRVWL